MRVRKEHIALNKMLYYCLVTAAELFLLPLMNKILRVTCYDLPRPTPYPLPLRASREPLFPDSANFPERLVALREQYRRHGRQIA